MYISIQVTCLLYTDKTWPLPTCTLYTHSSSIHKGNFFSQLMISFMNSVGVSSISTRNPLGVIARLIFVQFPHFCTLCAVKRCASYANKRQRPRPQCIYFILKAWCWNFNANFARLGEAFPGYSTRVVLNWYNQLSHQSYLQTWETSWILAVYQISSLLVFWVGLVFHWPQTYHCRCPISNIGLRSCSVV